MLPLFFFRPYFKYDEVMNFLDSFQQSLSSLTIESARQAMGPMHLTTIINFDHPSNLAHGDYSCNLALIYSKNINRPAIDLANEIISELNKRIPASSIANYINKIESAGPGFINFHLSKDFYQQSLEEIVNKGDEFGKNMNLKGKDILLEHSSPNLFKPFHIGHLVNNVIGESIGRILKNSGAKVITMTYPSDVSLGIAKAVWGVMDKGWESELTLPKLGEAYAWGTKRYEEDEGVKSRVIEINLNIYNKVLETKEWKVYVNGKSLSFEHFVEITKKLGSEFNEVVYESDTEVVGKKIVLEHVSDVFEKSDGAIIFRGSSEGLYDDVFINSAGFGTYLAKDVGLLSIKFSKFKFDSSVTITDIEQKSHFELVKLAVSKFEKEWADKSNFLQHGRLRLTEGRISSRMGNVPLAEELIGSMRDEIMTKMKEDLKSEEIAEQVAIGALKYPILRTSRGQNMVFDMNKPLSTEGDSGVYLQYAHARANSLLEKAKIAQVRSLAHGQASGNSQSTEPQLVEKLLYRFPEVIEHAQVDYAPHHITTYLTELASAFNNFYAHNQVIGDSPESSYRLAIVEAVKIVLKNGLNVLGIPAPERM